MKGQTEKAYRWPEKFTAARVYMSKGGGKEQEEEQREEERKKESEKERLPREQGQ